jgi:hypothetical protein
MRLVAFSEKPLCLIDVLKATMLQLHLPTIASSPQDFTQDKRGCLLDHSYSSGLAKTILVPGSPTIIVCKNASSSFCNS